MTKPLNHKQNANRGEPLRMWFMGKGFPPKAVQIIEISMPPPCRPLIRPLIQQERMMANAKLVAQFTEEGFTYDEANRRAGRTNENRG